MKIIKKIGQIVWSLLIAGVLISAAVWVGTFAMDLLVGGFKRLFKLGKK